MNGMAANKIVVNNETLIDLTKDSIKPSVLFDGETAHDASGNEITGTFSLDSEITQQDDLIYRIKTALQGKAAGGGGNTEPTYKDLYQRVEYITSAEEETYPYMITDVCATNTIGVEVIASFPKLQDRIPMGSRENSDATRFYCVYPMSANSVYHGFNTGVTTACTLKINTIYRLQTNFLNSRLVCVYENNGTRKANVSLSVTLSPSHTVPIAIFGCHSASSGTVTSKREYLLYNARISDGHEVIRDYIPCYRKSDGEIGLYEKVTGQFLTSAGGGSFAKGADVEWAA